MKTISSLLATSLIGLTVVVISFLYLGFRSMSGTIGLDANLALRAFAISMVVGAATIGVLVFAAVPARRPRLILWSVAMLLAVAGCAVSEAWLLNAQVGAISEAMTTIASQREVADAVFSSFSSPLGAIQLGVDPVTGRMWCVD